MPGCRAGDLRTKLVAFDEITFTWVSPISTYSISGKLVPVIVINSSPF